MQYKFAENVDALQPSAIREILKFTSMPGVISLPPAILLRRRFR